MRTYKYEKLTWPEVNQAVKEKRVVVIPVGTIEDHGHHLPIDADVVIANEMCCRAAELVSEKVVLLSAVVHGYSPHHMDFPGPITIKWSTFIEYVLDITRSLAQHGFERILLVNGHGSNIPLVQMVAKLTAVEYPEVMCCAVNWWDLKEIQNAVHKFRESKWPFGCSHACELETSIYLAVDEQGVLMEKAVADFNYPTSPHFFDDLIPAATEEETKRFKNNVHLMEWWSTQTETGVQGDPTVATAEKGRVILKVGAEELAEIIIEMQNRTIRKRKDHHLLTARIEKTG